MRPLFGDAGLSALRALALRSPLCLFDFDGTLAPLEPDPTRVMLPPPVQRRLQLLQQRVPIGIVTGRSLVDMRRRLDFHPDYLIGNHGLEGVPGAPVDNAVLAATCKRWKNKLTSRIAAIDPAIWLEDKQYSLTLHYLHARDVAGVAAALSTLLLSLDPRPRVISGKYIVNLLPEDSGDKGRAVLRLLQHTSSAAALYVGDDATDEDVFRLHEPRILSVRVGSEGDSAADWTIEDHLAIESLLDRLLACIPEYST
jgi:trehalose 6-phosphate phosphatase